MKIRQRQKDVLKYFILRDLLKILSHSIKGFCENGLNGNKCDKMDCFERLVTFSEQERSAGVTVFDSRHNFYRKS